MEKKLTAIKLHFKNGFLKAFNIDGNVTFRAKNDFQYIDLDGNPVLAFATSEVSFIEYFYSDAGSK